MIVVLTIVIVSVTIIIINMTDIDVVTAVVTVVCCKDRKQGRIKNLYVRHFFMQRFMSHM